MLRSALLTGVCAAPSPGSESYTSVGGSVVTFGFAMNPWFGKAVILAGAVAMVAIRAPHGRRSRIVRVVESRKGRLEVFLLTDGAAVRTSRTKRLIPRVW